MLCNLQIQHVSAFLNTQRLAHDNTIQTASSLSSKTVKHARSRLASLDRKQVRVALLAVNMQPLSSLCTVPDACCARQLSCWASICIAFGIQHALCCRRLFRHRHETYPAGAHCRQTRSFIKKRADVPSAAGIPSSIIAWQAGRLQLVLTSACH